MKLNIGLLILFSFNIILSQNHPDSKYFSAFDQYINTTNTELFSGELYVEKYPVRTKYHKFLGDGDFTIGNIWFDYEPYYNVQLKYDVYGDELLFYAKHLEMSSVIQLAKFRIQKFELNNRLFVNHSFQTSKRKDITGFVEELYKGNTILLYKKHNKKIHRRLDGKLFYEFKDDSRFYLQIKNTYYEINNVNDLLKAFSRSSDIKTVIDKNKKLGRNDFELFLKTIMRHMDITNVDGIKK